jgi:hypothetical protein
MYARGRGFGRRGWSRFQNGFGPVIDRPFPETPEQRLQSMKEEAESVENYLGHLRDNISRMEGETEK